MVYCAFLHRDYLLLHEGLMTGHLSKLPSLTDLGFSGVPTVGLLDSMLGISVISRTLKGPKFRFARMNGRTSGSSKSNAVRAVYAWKLYMRACLSFLGLGATLFEKLHAVY